MVLSNQFPDKTIRQLPKMVKFVHRGLVFIHLSCAFFSAISFDVLKLV